MILYFNLPLKVFINLLHASLRRKLEKLDELHLWGNPPVFLIVPVLEIADYSRCLDILIVQVHRCRLDLYLKKPWQDIWVGEKPWDMGWLLKGFLPNGLLTHNGSAFQRGSICCAGIGPAITFLLTAPAANTMRILLTGEMISWKVAGVLVASALVAFAGLTTSKMPRGKAVKKEYQATNAASAKIDILKLRWMKDF